jgi:hypothetical protein
MKTQAQAMSRVEAWHHLLLRFSLFTFGFSLILSIPYTGLIISAFFTPNDKITKIFKYYSLAVNFSFSLLILFALAVNITLGA